MQKETVDAPEQAEQKELTNSEVFKPETITRLMNKKYILFGIIVGAYYVLQFVCCVSACNMYSDVSRLTPCTSIQGSPTVV